MWQITWTVFLMLKLRFVCKQTCSQLFYDGHHNVAVELGTIVRADPPCPPSDKLLHAVVQGLAIQDQSRENMNIYKENVFCGIDLEFETEGTSIAPEPASYETG